MKRAVSVSLGSSKRNKAVEIELMGEKVHIERIGTDGDMEKAAQLFKELDGKVDAFGVGGTDLGALVGDKWYPLHSIQPMVRYVKETPIVDGVGLKNTLENRVVAVMDEHIGQYIQPRRVLVSFGVDRWGMTKAFIDGGYECVFGDLMFALGVPIPLRTEKSLMAVASVVAPIVTRLPFEWIYPTGDAQESRKPKFENYYRWATVIAGDRHYAVRYMPDELQGKVIVTNSTTEQDVELLRKIGIKYLVTTTPIFEGRSFGTNMMEAALIAISGKGRKLTFDELDELINTLGFEPQIMELN